MDFIWHHINILLPTFSTPVILNKDESSSFENSRLGRLTLDDYEINLGWFVDNEIHVITLESRPYWCNLLDIDVKFQTLEEIEISNFKLDNFYNKLSLLESKIIFMSRAMVQSGNGTYMLDYYISGILNRSLSLLYGFETLIKSGNYIGALHLTRPHLDNFLRLFASFLVNKPHDFAKEVWRGVPINKIKDRNEKYMKDVYLKQEASKEYPWVFELYEELSGYIHFSNKHISNSTTIDKDKQHLITFIGKSDNQISDQERIKAINDMILITNCIIERVYGWIETKRIYG